VVLFVIIEGKTWSKFFFFWISDTGTNCVNRKIGRSKLNQKRADGAEGVLPEGCKKGIIRRDRDK
jgi:hypothetical protein